MTRELRFSTWLGFRKVKICFTFTLPSQFFRRLSIRSFQSEHLNRVKSNRNAGCSRTPRKVLADSTFGQARAWRFTWPAVLTLVGLLCSAAESAKPKPAEKPDELLRITKVWAVRLEFTPDQWEAMEPKGGGGMFFGGPRQAEGRRGPFGEPGGLAAPGPIGPAIILAPGFVRSGDQNHDGNLSKEEFSALAEKWFTEWDKEKRGKLNREQVAAGINSNIPLPVPGGPPAGGPDGRGPAIRIPFGQQGRRNGLAGAAGIQYPYVHADLEFDGQVLKDVAVRYKGNSTFMSSRGSLKRPLKLDLNKFVKGQKLAGVSKLNFRNHVMDATWMNEVMSYQLFRDAGVPAPRTAYARVFVNVPGKHNQEYLGLYSIIEDIDTNFAEERFGSKKGAIFKPVGHDLFGYRGENWSSYKPSYDPKTDLSEKQIRRVIDFAKLVSNASDPEFAAKLGDYLDLDEFARFMAVTVWLPTLDSLLGPGHNFYVYLHPKTHKFQFFPWDLDHSFGQFGLMGGQNSSESLSIHRPWLGENRFLERVFKVEAFKKLYLAKLDEFSKTIFQPERLHEQMDAIAAAIRPAVREESTTKLARFERLLTSGTPEPGGLGDVLVEPAPGVREGPRFGGPGGMFPPGKTLKSFVKSRAQSVKDQLAGKSEGQTWNGPGFGGPGGPQGIGRRGGPGAPPLPLGLGNALGNSFMAALDSNKDGEITRAEFTQGFARWFESWNPDKSGAITEEQLRAGLGRDLMPFRAVPPGVPPPPRE